MLLVSSLSTEYILVKVRATVSGEEINPTADVVQMAFMPEGTQPTLSDWHGGTWDTDLTTVPATYFGQVLVGPAIVPLTAGIFDVWIKVTDNPEIPARRVGNMEVY